MFQGGISIVVGSVLLSSLCFKGFVLLFVLLYDSLCHFVSSNVIILLTVPRRCFFCGSFLLSVVVFVILSRLFHAALCSMQHCDHLLGKG